MDHFEQTEHFNTELDKLIDRIRQEYEMSYESLIGALQIKSVQLGLEAIEKEKEDRGEKDKSTD